MTVINIEIISDIVCAWCFVGKRSLERAIMMFQKTYPGGKDDTFNITWRPYYLDYGRFVAATHSVDKAEVAKVKFKGVSKEKMTAMSNRVYQICRANGIALKMGGKIGSTRDAHRLIHFSQNHATSKVQDAVVEELFQAYHEREMDISDLQVLIDIAVEAGLNEDQISTYLRSDEDKQEVDKQAEENRPSAPTGVPTFFIQNEYQVDGAQDLQEFFESFVKVKENEQSLNPR